MNEWLDLSDGGWWNLAGWTMLHFLWLGTLVGLAAGVLRIVLRRSSANVRYVAALGSFIVLAALPIGIGAWLWTGQFAPIVDLAEAAVLTNDDDRLARPSAPAGHPASGSAGGNAGAVSAERTLPSTPITSSEPAVATNTSAKPRQSRGLTDLIASVAGYLPWAWLTGTPLTFLLLTTGVIGAERLRRSSRILDDGPIAEACAELARSLRIGRKVTVAVCERIASPVLVGIVRPMILLPSSALTGWSPEEIEMVLLHELAHVRRWDNLVNLLQRFVEAALFFHPVVWIVSRWVRTEREACCDAMVVGRTNRPHAYAEMLVALAAQLPRSVLFHPAATSAMAAGPLRTRIHRILSLDSGPMLVSGKSLGVVMSGLLLAATLVVLNLPGSTHAEDEPTTKSISAGDPTLVDVPFEIGATKFADGDEIKITEIRGTSNTFKPGNEFWIKGTFTLRSQERATLGASVTAPSSPDAATPHDPAQSVDIVRGSGEFTLKLPMHRGGWPHVSFYPIDGGQSFGGVYFGTGDYVLKEWWKELPRGASSEVDNRIETPAVKQEQKRQVEAMNQMRHLALALHNYHDTKGSFPANASYDTFDRPLLSWRVHLLPFLDEEGAAELYKEFRLNEPWDSEHNRALIPRMPAVYKNPNAAGTGFTNYLAPVGKDCMFNGTPDGVRLAQVPDGTANTIMLVEADDGVEWTRPSDLNFQIMDPTAGLGLKRPNGWLAAFADGSLRLVSKKESLNDIRDLFTRGVFADSRAAEQRLQNPAFRNPLTQAIDRFNALAQTNDIGRNQLALTQEEVLSAIENYDWVRARVEPRIREIFETITETHALPGDAKIEFITRVESRYGGTADGWWVSLSVMTGPDKGYSLPIRVPSPVVYKSAPTDQHTSRFPTLDEQKLADEAYRRIGLELEAIGEEDLKRVKALGYDGGLLATSARGDTFPIGVGNGDVLVGLHVWPTRTIQDLLEILNRDDLAELNPLKYYIVRHHAGEAYGLGARDEVVTGRVEIPLKQNSAAHAAPTTTYGPADAASLEPRSVTIEDRPVQPQSLPFAAVPDTNRVEPMPAEAVIALRERGPVVVEVFYQDKSEPCRQMLAALQEFHRANSNLNVDIIRRNADVELAALAKYDVEHTPFLVITKNGKVLRRLSGPLSAANLTKILFNVAVKLSDTTEERPTLRYNGKTFEEWRTAWQTELSLEKRLEVVKALAAFGASGRGKEAAEAILDVADQLDWTYIQDSAKGRLQQACIDSFTSAQATDGYRIPSDDWFPLVIPIVENSGEKFTFATYLADRLSPGEKNLIPRLIELTKNSNTRTWAIQGLKAIDPKLEDPRVLKYFRDALSQQGQPAADAQMLIYYLSYAQNPGGPLQGAALRFVPELEPYLFDADEGTRRKARLAISWIQPADARELVKRLIARLDDGSDKDRTEVIRALSAIGPRALPAESRLEKISHSSSDPNRYVAAVALGRVRGERADTYATLGVDPQTTPMEPHRRQIETEQHELFPDGVYPPHEPMFSGGGGGGGVF